MNRRNEIVETALRLFINQGYHATSIRQIAAEVGCQESAIYCHFANGKRQLLHTILADHMPDLEELLNQCLTTSPHTSDDLGPCLVSLALTHLQDWQWIVGEFPALRPEERAIVRTRLLSLFQGISQQLEIHDRMQGKNTLAWLLLTFTAGYATLYRLLGPEFDFNVTPNHLASLIKFLVAESSVPEKQTNAQ